MSKKASTDLHELIHNMNASEKRYFKLYVQRHFTNNSIGLKLFEYISGLEEYDEVVLLKKFKKESFTNKFAITKARLYDQILNSLHAYYISKSVNAQLYKQLHVIEVLFDKALYQQCDKLIRSARKLAEKNECFEVLVLIDNWEKKLIENSGFHIEKSDLEAFLKHEESAISRIVNNNKIWRYKSELFFLLNHKDVQSKEQEQEKVREILKKAFSILPSGFQEKYTLNHLKSGCYFALGELINCSDYLQKNYDLLEKNKDQVRSHPANFLSTSTNLIYTKIKLSDFESAHKLLADLKQFRDRFDIDWNTDIDIKWFSSLKSIELNYRIEKGDVPALQQLISSLDKDLEHYRTKLSPLRLSYFLFKKAGIEIQLGTSDKALKTLNELLNGNQLEQREDIFTYARMIEVVAQYDMGKFELLPYTIRSLQRFLKKRSEEFSFELDLIKYLSKACKMKPIEDRAELWSKLLAEMEENPLTYASSANRYFNFVNWVKAQVRGASMTEVA